MNKKQLGSHGEELAVNYLLEHDYQIIQRNFQCFLGEIDIISRKHDLMVFIEVKTRLNTNFGLAKESVTRQKQRKLYRLAEYYLNQFGSGSKLLRPRFDVIEVYLLKEQVINYKIVHLEGAF
jgi:putative endonuclease